MDLLGRLVSEGSLPLILLALVIAGLGVPLPEDLVLLAAGVLAHRGDTPWWVVLPACMLGVLAGDSLLFKLVRHLGPKAATRAPLKWVLRPKVRARVKRLVDERGAVAVFAARHMSGLRGPVFAMAALEGMPFGRFLLADALGVLITVPVVVGLGYFFSAHVDLVEHDLARAEHWGLFGLAVVGVVAFAVVSWRRRRAVLRASDSSSDSSPDAKADSSTSSSP